MIFVVLVVLIRRGNAKEEEWDEEEFYEVSEEDEERLVGDSIDSVEMDVVLKKEQKPLNHRIPTCARRCITPRISDKSRSSWCHASRSWHTTRRNWMVRGRKHGTAILECWP